jgi:hypothetical protein
LSGIKSFIDKVKQKNTEFKLKQDERKAASKGFSSSDSYKFYSGEARSEGEESGKSELRKRELKKIKDEAKEEAMMGRYGKFGRVQKKVQRGFQTFQKGAGIYNEVMGELHSMNSSQDSFFPTQNSNQAYASGYGAFNPNKPKRRKSSTKKTKPKRRSKPRQSRSFWDQYM